MTEDKDIEDIRAEKLEKLREQEQNNEEDIEQEMQEREAARKELLRKILSEDARKRLKNVSLVDEEKARKVEDMLINMSQQNKLRGQVTEAQIRNILSEISVNKKFNIKGMNSRKNN